MGAEAVLQADRDRARHLFGTRAVRPLGEGAYLIEGSVVDPETGKKVVYTVNTQEGSCTCPRFEKKLGWQDLACKHLAFLWEAEGLLRQKGKG